MKKNVVFFSCEPGGAEVLAPVVALLQAEPDLQVTVLSYGFGLNRFRSKGVACVEIAPIGEADYSIFETYKPSLIITSATSLPHKDMSEKMLWKNSKVRGIRTIAFLDQWQNYSARFSGPCPGERLAYLPDFINCINEIGYEDMVAEGFDRNILIPMGQPYLSLLARRAAVTKREEVSAKTSLPSDKKIIAFISEPIEENFGLARGYTQYSALKFFLSNIFPAEDGAFLLLKLHDKDDSGKYFAAVEGANRSVLIVHKELTPLETLMLADEVYGMTSILLIESYILCKPTISIQPGLKNEDPMVLSRRGYIKRISSEKDLRVCPPAFNIHPFTFAFKETEFLALARSLIR